MGQRSYRLNRMATACCNKSFSLHTSVYMVLHLYRSTSTSVYSKLWSVQASLESIFRFVQKGRSQKVKGKSIFFLLKFCLHLHKHLQGHMIQ